jgi:hypothetical protein
MGIWKNVQHHWSPGKWKKNHNALLLHIARMSILKRGKVRIGENVGKIYFLYNVGYVNR